MSIRSISHQICSPESGAATFFKGILVWGIGMGCFGGVLHNYVYETYAIDGFDRGVMEFMREIPGVLLVGVLALLSRFSDWRVLRLGTLVSVLAAVLLCFDVPARCFSPWAAAVGVITLWSLGEHTVMPARQSLALMLAKDGKGGESLGFMTAMMNVGTVAGCLLACLIFFLGPRFADGEMGLLYKAVFALVAVFLFASVVFSLRKEEPGARMRNRPRFYFRRKYSKFYALELFYGARKQVFFTFGPFLLVDREFGFGLPTWAVALLLGVSALFTALWGGRLVGRLVDRWGYRNVMIWDTVVLSIVCLLYGFAKDVFPASIALVVVCVNYILDAILSNCSIATNLYARTLSDTQEELSATLSSGISINHVITVFYALLGGWIYSKFGPGFLFSTAAVMALANSAFALTVPRPAKLR